MKTVHEDFAAFGLTPAAETETYWKKKRKGDAKCLE